MREHMDDNEKHKEEKQKMKDQYYIVRGDRSGVFFGQITKREGREVQMTNVRRLWRWNGATECCQLAAEGVKRPRDCKFTLVVSELTVLDVIEVQPCTDEAAASLSGVPVWKM